VQEALNPFTYFTAFSLLVGYWKSIQSIKATAIYSSAVLFQEVLKKNVGELV